jgi:hypothetical protein
LNGVASKGPGARSRPNLPGSRPSGKVPRNVPLFRMEHPTVVIDMLDRTTGTGSSPSAASALSLWGLVALCSAVLGLFPSRADGQEGSLQGRVRDADGASVFAAVVDLLRAGDSIPLRTSETDALGYYLFEDLEAGTYELRVGRLGYFQARVTAFVAPSEPTVVDVALRETALEIQGLSVEVERSRERARFEAQAGLTSSELAGADLKKIPGVAESDPIRAVEVLPGVVSTSDFTAAFNVRGGSADQNLILLDGLPVFNPFHLGGVFSVFNADMVQRAELLAGGFPAEYGGRVSSVLTIESDAGNGDWDVDTGICLRPRPTRAEHGAVESIRETVLFRSGPPSRLRLSLPSHGSAGGLRSVDGWGQSLDRDRLHRQRRPELQRGRGHGLPTQDRLGVGQRRDRLAMDGTQRSRQLPGASRWILQV